MNEACRIVPYGRARYCRTCGTVFDPTLGETSPCDARPTPVATRIFATLRPRTVFGLVVWSWIGAGLIAVAVGGVLFGLSGAVDHFLRLVVGG